MDPPTKPRKVTIVATINRGGDKPRLDCTVTEISGGNAQLSVPEAFFVPDTFTLSFAGATEVRRLAVRCGNSGN
jgi:hypothetical protein